MAHIRRLCQVRCQVEECGKWADVVVIGNMGASYGLYCDKHAAVVRAHVEAQERGEQPIKVRDQTVELPPRLAARRLA